MSPRLVSRPTLRCNLLLYATKPHQLRLVGLFVMYVAVLCLLFGYYGEVVFVFCVFVSG